MLAAVVVGVVAGSMMHFAPLCHRPSIFLDDAEAQYCDIRDSADVGAREHSYPADATRTGFNLRLAGAGDYTILFLAGQHQGEETARSVALMLGADGAYLDRQGNFEGVAGGWSLPVADMIDARDADPGTVALLVKKPSQN